MKFANKVYRLVRKIPKGRISTYKEVSRSLGRKAYRAVGNALNKNPYTEVPCHRIVNSNGNLGGFSKGVKEKVRLLRKEGIKIKSNKIIDFKKVFYKLK